jgi:hypothetical protein
MPAPRARTLLAAAATKPCHTAVQRRLFFLTESHAVMRDAAAPGVFDEEALDALERAVQELEALESIYGYDAGGFTVHSPAELALSRSMVDAGLPPPAGAAWAPPQLELELRLELDGDGDGSAVARLRCALPPGYPTTAAARPSVTVEGLRRTRQDELTAALQAKADELLGEESVVELAQALEAVYSGVVADERTSVAAAERSPCAGNPLEPEPELSSSAHAAVGQQLALSSVLLHIDHMNDSSAYIRKLQLWTDELGLGGVLLYRMRTKAVNATSGGRSVTPKGRAEEIFVLLDGLGASTAEFLSRLRTQKMTGQDRHERKSTVVWDSSSAGEAGSVRRVADGLVAEEYSSPAELRERWAASIGT